MVLVLMCSAAGAAALALGALLGPGSGAVGAAVARGGAQEAHEIHSHARRRPLAKLDATFRRLLPSARCAAAGRKRAAAKRRRALALRGARKAPPKVLRRKKASMRRAIALMRSASKLCAAATPQPTPQPGSGAGAPPPPPAPGPSPGSPPTPPPAPPIQTIVLHVDPGPTFQYTETSATARAGAMRLELVNQSSLRHFVAVRTAPGQPTIAESPLSEAGGTVFVDVTLAAGTYQIFCRNNGHDQLGMVIPLTVTA